MIELQRGNYSQVEIPFTTDNNGNATVSVTDLVGILVNIGLPAGISTWSVTLIDSNNFDTFLGLGAGLTTATRVSLLPGNDIIVLFGSHTLNISGFTPSTSSTVSLYLKK